MSLRIPMVLFLTLFLGCSLPRIYVIDDPLSAYQHNDLGLIYETQGHLELAAKEYALAARKDRRWAVPHFNLGNVYFKLGDARKAETHYRQALQRDPENPDVMNNLAYVLHTQGDHEEAEKWIRRALSIRRSPEYLDTKKKIQSGKSESN